MTGEADFEKSFEDFLQSDNFDSASDVMFLLARSAFLSGWRSARTNDRGGKELKAIKGGEKKQGEKRFVKFAKTPSL